MNQGRVLLYHAQDKCPHFTGKSLVWASSLIVARGTWAWFPYRMGLSCQNQSVHKQNNPKSPMKKDKIK